MFCAPALQRNFNQVTQSENSLKLLQVNKIVQYTAVFTLLLYKYVSKAPAILLKFTLLCIGIFIGIMPETLYFYWHFNLYFRGNLDSVIFLRFRWQPWICHLVKICFRCCWKTLKKEARWGKKRSWRPNSRLWANAVNQGPSTWYQDVDGVNDWQLYVSQLHYNLSLSWK